LARGGEVLTTGATLLLVNTSRHNNYFQKNLIIFLTTLSIMFILVVTLTINRKGVKK